MGPTFVISLDFELFWGVIETKTVQAYGDAIVGVQQALPAMLDLFDAYGVKATFATVGFLFHKNSLELRQAWPELQPRYHNPKLSTYAYPFQDGPLFFAPELVELLKSRPQHEIGTHTFSHFFCNEGASHDSFRADLQAALRSGRQLGIEQTSIVFPRNQIDEASLRICREVGLSAFRGNRTSWLYRLRLGKLATRVLGQLDTYVNLSGHNHYPWSRLRHPCGLANVATSSTLRPHRPRQPWMDSWQVRRIQNSLEDSARHHAIYHIYWHPHNFGRHLEANLRMFERVLEKFAQLRQRYGMQSKTMREVAECFATSS